MTSSGSKSTIRRRWHLKGQVQGVGFRPFVWRLAQERHLSGLVRNDQAGVVIEAQGTEAELESFAVDLRTKLPPLARIEGIEFEKVALREGDGEFQIESSETDTLLAARVTVDTAVCPECLAEMRLVGNQRFGYGLINCTNCGPRYTIIQRVPYDRPNTTMVGFEMCDACHEQYSKPADRRFHAQPIACPACGPRVELVDASGRRIGEDAIEEAARMLIAGKIVAIKGLGGFHLAVRADDEAAVARLRAAKQRNYKPFAVMCSSINEARKLVKLGARAEAMMRSPACPIVLAEKVPGAALAESVAPGNHRLGVMLPYTPIQHLLLSTLGAQSPTLVMTSANVADEPLITDSAEAMDRLAGMCDAILWHDRGIARAVDDSVVIDMGDADAIPLRRARGYVPGEIALPLREARPGLALGGELKNTVAAVRDGQAILSQHLGDLMHPRAFEAFKKHVADLCDLFGVKPQWLARDAHPAYLSSQYAERLGMEWNVPQVVVQHHHAHAAAVMAEHGSIGPVLAVVCDGTGYGLDGTSWGGELLMADLRGFRRLASLRPMVLAGGDAAAKDTRRCAMALLRQAYGEGFAEHAVARRLFADDGERQMIAQMMRSGTACAVSSGAGRLFDGIAAILGLCDHNWFEAQAAMALEGAASRFAGTIGEQALYEVQDGNPARIDFAPLVREIVAKMEGGSPVEELAMLLHEQFSLAWVAAVTAASARTGIKEVALSGGTFCNERITKRLEELLCGRGLRVMRHRVVPPNDGGLALGQAAVAAARSEAGLIGKAGA